MVHFCPFRVLRHFGPIPHSAHSETQLMDSTVTPSGASSSNIFKARFPPFFPHVGPVQTTTLPSKAFKLVVVVVLEFWIFIPENPLETQTVQRMQAATVKVRNEIIVSAGYIWNELTIWRSWFKKKYVEMR